MRHLLRRALGLLVATVVALGLALVTAPAAQACTCGGDELGTALGRADVVGMVTPTSETTTTPPTGLGERRYEVTVERVYRGDVGATATVVTAEHSAACGAALRPGESQLLVAGERDGMLTTTSCAGRYRDGSRFVSMTQADVERALGPGAAPATATPVPTPAPGERSPTTTTSDGASPGWAAPVLVVAGGLAMIGVAALVAAVIVVRRRSPTSFR